MISIGAVYRGPELRERPAYQRIGALMRAAIKFRGWFEVGTRPGINVVFYVPGSLGDFDFDEPRESKFSRKKQYLMVQVPVPKSEVNSQSLDDFLIKSLREANLIATQVFQEKKMVYPYREAEELVNQIEQEMKVSD
jgi:hypothetical protein